MTSAPPGRQSGGPEDRPPGDGPRLQPTGPGVVTAWTVAGLVVGWLARRLLGLAGLPAPVVGWLQVLVLAFGAAVLGGTAWITWRSVHVRRERPDPQRMVNRLVLARACALVGALLAGGFVGYAVSWLGVPTELAGQRLLSSLAAAAAGAGMTIASLLLERACRVPGDDEGT